MRYLKLLIIVVIPLLLTDGCNQISPPIEGRADPYSSPQLDFSDAGLRDQTAIGRIAVIRDSSDLMHVDVPIRSTTDAQIIIDYRVMFMDQNNVPLSAPTGWTAVTLPPNVYQDIQVNSSSTRATDFRMDLRYAR